MDKNGIIGIVLIFGILLLWAEFNKPTEEEMVEQQRVRDSIALAERPSADPETESERILIDTSETTHQAPELSDSLRQIQLASHLGAFAASGEGIDTTHTLENDLVRITFSSKGGYIKEAYLKKHFKMIKGEDGKEIKIPLKLLEDEKNRFEYILPVLGTGRNGVSTSDLYFNAETSGNTMVLKANASPGQFLEQRYTLSPDSYQLDYQLRLVGLNNVMDRQVKSIQLNWINYLDKLEKSSTYERSYSTVYFKPAIDGVDYCSCRSSDEEDVDKNIKWISHANQFFNSTLIAEKSFNSAHLETVMLEDEDEDLKKIVSQIQLPYEGGADESIAMHWYIGPNEFERLKAYDMNMEDIIPFGWSIFGTINRWVIRPIFNFLSSFIGSAGLVILLLTVIVKMLLYPLYYKMLYSQSKMAALKPYLTKLKEKHGEDQKTQQMETMKLYREFGVNPLGGCFPVVLQMPIWFALYRFFPGSIEFRQASFLWATDLSSYDEFVQLGFNIPFYGEHVSLFTILWAATTVIYTYYNSKHMDFSTMNPMMKYMQYFMPIMFLFFFNNYASGLTCYLLFSNLMNIGQTLVTKEYIIDKEKIRRELEAYRKKPKKKGGFQERLAKAMQEQQRVQAEKEKGGNKKTTTTKRK